MNSYLLEEKEWRKEKPFAQGKFAVLRVA